MKTRGNLAALDIGTNSFHLIVVSVKEDGSFEIIDRVKEVIRLGEGNPGDIKRINPEAEKRAISAIKRFKGVADSHNAQFRAVATSAVRESLNKNEFIKNVKDATGVDVEVVSGNEEARLIYLGVLKAVPVFDKKVLCIDIGGGSTEFIIGEKGKIHYSSSLKLGAVRLTQKFFPEGKTSYDSIQKCKKWIEGEIFHIGKFVKEHGITEAIGSSGTIMSAALMTLAKNDSTITSSTILNNYVFKREELEIVKNDILSKSTPEERKKIEGLDSKRADIISAGILIISTIVEKFNLSKITISGYALREGIIIDSLPQFYPDLNLPNLSDIRFASVKQLAESSKFDRKHCDHVADLAASFFDQTKELHKLTEREKEYLICAAKLHDIGYHIAHAQHHRHSYYIIRNSELLGFNENEIRVIANIARYHRKSHPKKKHPEYEILSAENKIVVKKLASILRIVDSLDRTHSGKVSKINLTENSRILEIDPNVPLSEIEVESWSLERRKGLFEEVFGKRIKLVNLK